MPKSTLFHSQTLKKALLSNPYLKNGAIPANHLKLLQNWLDSVADGSAQQQSEGSLQNNFFNPIFENVLGYTSFTNKNKKTNIWTLSNEKTIKESGRVDIALGRFSTTHNEIIIPVELKTPKTTNMDRPMLGRELSTVAQAHSYAQNSQGQAKWIIITNGIEIRLYKYPYSDSIYQSWQLADLIEAEHYQTFILLLSAPNLLTSKTQNLFEASQVAEKEITNQLYRDYRHIRVKLINGMKRENNRISRKAMVSLAQMLLDRVLFIAYAEDCKLLPINTFNHYLNSHNDIMSAWDMLKRLFKDIDQGNVAKNIPKYNGDLFKPHDALEKLTISNELLAELKTLSAYDFDSGVNVTILGHIFEQSITDLDQIYETITEQDELQVQQQQQGTSGKRKQDGVVYTPNFITDWMVKNTLGAYLTKQQQSITAPPDSGAWWLAYRKALATTRIIDPACGSGAFLVAAFQYLQKEYKNVNERLKELGEKGEDDLFGIDLNHDILTNNLFGVDINAESVEIARLSLWLVTAESGKPLTSLKNNIKQGNSIITDKKLDKHAFHWHGTFKAFDVVLGNPPYVRQERLSPFKTYLEQHYQTYHGVADLYTYFFELGLNLLKKGGIMGFISSATFFRTSSGENLRRFLQVEANLKHIVNFGDLQVFAGVTTYPAILILEKPTKTRKKAPQKAFQFLNICSTNIEALKQELSTAVFSEIPQNQLASDGWRLEDKRLQQLREKIISNKPTLKTQYGQPLYGIKTGLNAAFVMNQATRDQLIKADPLAAEIIKPFLEGKDIKKWHVESRHVYLILFPKGWTRKKMQQQGIATAELSEVQAWEWLQTQYPTLCEHLMQYIEAGKKRGDKGEFWWELRACAYYDDFQKEKIIYAHFQNQPLFSYDEHHFYTNNKCYIFEQGGYYELGVLTSNVVWWIFTGSTTAVQGGYYEATTQRIANLPIPNATQEQQETIATLAQNCQNLAEQRYTLQNQLRQLITSLCPKDQTPKLSNKLLNGWELSINEFTAEIKKTFKHDMTLQESAQWITMLDTTKAGIEQHSLDLAIKERELNQAVYQLFQLTPEEIALLEADLQ